MARDRRLVEDFIFRDEANRKTATMPLNLIVLPKEELRYYIDPEEVEKIVASARKNGILEPLLIRPIPGHEQHEVVAGAKRYRAAQILQLQEVPVVVRQLSDEDALEIALIENFARSALTDLEETDGVVRLLAVKLKILPQEVPPLLHHIQNQQRGRTSANNVIGNDVIAVVQSVLTSLGNIKLDSFISNRLPLLNLPSDILEVLRQGKLETSKAKAIARVGDEETRKQLLEDAIAYNFSLNEIKRKIKEIEQQVNPQTPSIKHRVDDTLRRLKQSKIWDDPKKKIKVEKLLAQLDTLMKDDNTN
ncbi:MAG: ParB/RepB/Spo0J family partition protein [Pelatocladus maniniholoensis HA4357-MV3]|jgi:ParB family transcriptional regulator, chromosome partitioning protein|uniref:ParB/RepB/Spo0J family partition protein n=1 Tax=Pelatocladus maniniholoensis HA4357-MV3 TaxID=1117104 RepID=A0A9E3H9K3_9NOST|nr:ParB/RepB/Spo0J family partition protein [Pelatocladus maniniholoensis HA4357-MV3]